MLQKRENLYLFLFIACIAGLGWLALNHAEDPEHGLTLCLFRAVTSLPCPSCGTTRSVWAVMHGDFFQALYYNPLGYIVLPIMLITPVWIIIDLLTKSQSLMLFYKRVESALRKRNLAAVLIGLILLNWVWNIYKYVW